MYRFCVEFHIKKYFSYYLISCKNPITFADEIYVLITVSQQIYTLILMPQKVASQ